jgi:hypothetical protein
LDRFSALCALFAKRVEHANHACKRANHTNDQTDQQKYRLGAKLPVKQPACTYPCTNASYNVPTDAR